MSINFTRFATNFITSSNTEIRTGCQSFCFYSSFSFLLTFFTKFQSIAPFSVAACPMLYQSVIQFKLENVKGLDKPVLEQGGEESKFEMQCAKSTHMKISIRASIR